MEMPPYLSNIDFLYLYHNKWKNSLQEIYEKNAMKVKKTTKILKCIEK